MGATLASEAWWERGDGCWLGRRGKLTASQGSEAVARRKVNSDCPLSDLAGVLGKVKLPLRLQSWKQAPCLIHTADQRESKNG